LQLVSVDGARLGLRVVGYQFPDPGVLPNTGGDFDYDASWLVIEGQVATAEGRSWAFEDPCLLVPEARELGSWLQIAAAGTFGRYRKRDGATLEFLEPNLTFALRRHTVERAVLRVGFSHESAPDPQPESPGAFQVLLRLSSAALRRAADAWAQEVAAFPPR
jgi:hypothetical protein